MSYVTNAILCYSIIEDDWRSSDLLVEVNKFFGKQKGFVHIDDERHTPLGWYGGPKLMEINIALGAFNYLDADDLIAHISKMAWKEPESVQLLLCTQDENKFSFAIDGLKG